MGGLRRNLPITFFTFLLGGASLAGIPFFSGFLSKEAILAAVWLNNSALSWVMLVTMVGVSFITVLYTFRLLWYIFMGTPRKPLPGPVVEPPLVMRGTVLVLALCSLWLVVSWNPFDSTGWLLPQAYYTHVLWITIFSVVWILAALAVSYRIFNAAQFNGNKLLENGFYLDILYHKTFGGMMQSAATAAAYVDKRWIDGLIHRTAYAHVTVAHITAWFDRAIVDGFVNGLASTARGIGSFTRSFQGGKIQVYIFWAILAIIIFLIWTLK
jgi:NADH-quinone oxidoreductase subunit L